MYAELLTRVPRPGTTHELSTGVVPSVDELHGCHPHPLSPMWMNDNGVIRGQIGELVRAYLTTVSTTSTTVIPASPTQCWAKLAVWVPTPCSGRRPV